MNLVPTPHPSDETHTCPFCDGVTTTTVEDEINHMREAHPDIIRARLLKAGLLDPRER